jgi:dTDP-4-amino-4,6-dideoxygalactose transaminase
MQFIDLQRQYKEIEDEVKHRFEDILNNTRFIMGKEVEELEHQLAGYVGVKHCITCASGTDALLMPLMMWNIGRGDAVFVPSFSFFASAEVIGLVGATPVFIDADEKTFNIDLVKLEEAVENVLKEGKLTPKVVISVDLFGQPADNPQLEKICSKYGLLLLEDGAQGFGGSINGRKACSFGDVAATSFFPAKPLGCYGDGGAIFTNNDEYAELLKSVRIHGQGKDKYENIRLGLNGRLDTLQAAVLLSKLRIFDKELENRDRIAKAYIDGLKDRLTVPYVRDGYFSSWAQFSILACDSNEREKIIAHLKEKDIPIAIYYQIPLHRQKAFADSFKPYCDLSVCEKLSGRIFSIPMHPYLENEELDHIIASIKEVSK